MNSFDLFRMAFQNLWRRKLRTFLTILGVVIGTTSIVVMLSLGLGMKASNQQLIEQMGDVTAITVTPLGADANPFGRSSTNTRSSTKKGVLNKNAIESFKKLDGVIATTPVKNLQIGINYRRFQTSAEIIGIDPAVMETMGYKVVEGRTLKNGDKMVAVFGGQIKGMFYDPKSPSGKNVQTDPMKDSYTISFQDYENKNPKKYPIKVVGVMSEQNFTTAFNIVMPISEVEKLEKLKPKLLDARPGSDKKLPAGTYNTVMVKVGDVKKVEAVQTAIKEMGFGTYSLKEEAKSFEQATNVLQAILGGIGGISLLVAAIGITNTMIMSIYERTREIGVMKVIGAAISDIKKLFLVEAGLIGLSGGIAGSIFSLLISLVLNTLFANSSMSSEFASKISIVPIWLIMAALIFSSAIGLVSGYLPAQRAMKLSALEAIRTE